MLVLNRKFINNVKKEQSVIIIFDLIHDNNQFSDYLIQYLRLNSNIWFNIFDGNEKRKIDEKIIGKLCNSDDFWICGRVYAGR